MIMADVKRPKASWSVMKKVVESFNVARLFLACSGDNCIYPRGTFVDPSNQLTFKGVGKEMTAENMPVWAT